MSPESEAFEGPSPRPTRRKRRLIARLAMPGFVACAAILLVAITFHYRRVQHSAARETERLQEVRDALRTTATRLEQGETQASLDRNLILGVLGQCRTAGDIPEFAGDRVAARQQGPENTLFYVPKGSHQLEIVAAWRPAESTRASDDGQRVAGEGADVRQKPGAKTWRVPLLPESCYQMEIISGRGPARVQWKLTSANPEFAARHEFLPLKEFDRHGYSWGGRGGPIAFPNQVKPFSIRSAEQLFQTRPGLELPALTLRGDLQDRPYEIEWTQTLISAGPACVAASDVDHVLARTRGDVLGFSCVCRCGLVP